MEGARVGGSSPKGPSALTSAWQFGLLASSFLLLSTPSGAYGQLLPIQLEGFVVTGTPVPRLAGTVANHVTVLKGEELRLEGMTWVSEALSKVPGLVVVQAGSFGSVSSVFFRGAESDHVKVLVDGVEVNLAGGGYDLSGLLVSEVERIEIVRGPSSAFYGSDAMAGVIQVITRQGGGAMRGSIAAGGGTYGRRNWGGGLYGGGGSAGYALSVSRVTSDGILAFNNQSENLVLSGKVSGKPDGRTRMSVLGRYSDRTFHYPTDASGNLVDRNARTFGAEKTVRAEMGYLVAENVEVLAALTGYWWDGGADDPSDGPADTLGFFEYRSEDLFRRTSGDLRLSLAPRAGLVLSMGLELEEEKQRSSSESRSEFGPSSSDDRFRRWNKGSYVHLLFEDRSWSGNVGFRLDDNEQYGRFFTYQAGLSYVLPALGLRLRGSLGRGLKEPTFLEAYSTGYAIGNPDLEPERSWSWEVGIEHSVGEAGLYTSLTLFHESLQDLIQYAYPSPVPGGTNFFNVADAVTRGLEASVAMPLGAMRLTGAYTFLDTKVLDAGFDEGESAVFVEGEPLIRRPRHQASLGGICRLSAWTLTGNVRWTATRSDRDFSVWPGSPVTLAAYTVLDLGAEVEILDGNPGRPGLSIHLQGRNLLDAGYQEVFGFDAPGRSALVGLEVLLGALGR